MSNKYNRSEVATTANTIFYSPKNKKEANKSAKGLKNEFISKSDAWFYAHLIYQIKRELRTSVLFVRFQKSNGEVTERKATLKAEYINYESKGSTRKKNPLQVKYYEKDSDKFKSFNITRLKFYKAA